ncbi:MAG TPA: hypothetical protein PLE74_07455 [Candidatus Cloacimonadota bacterium]|nr:hypothetical protein [Candidatus Cloacimonadota bacterium]HPT72103.1 hypothetical protein [Candidatus Cloacimonadota bacterium]
MRKVLLLAVSIAILFVLFGCSEKDKNPTKVYGYQLGQFISKSAVYDSTAHWSLADSTDMRGLYAYEIVSADSNHWSPRESSNAGYDLSWNLFKNGFYMASDVDQKSWFPNTNLPGAFKVKRVGFFRLYRKVDVIAPDGTSKMVELKGLQTYQIDNWNTPATPETAIKLSDLVQGIAVYDSLHLVAVDNFTKTYTPAQINEGYYLLNSEITTFPAINNQLSGGLKKFKDLAYIEVFGASAPQTQTFTNAPHNTADMIILLPSSMNGYTATDVTGLLE